MWDHVDSSAVACQMFLRLELEEEEADLRHRASCITHDRAKREASPAEVLVFESVTCICAVGTLNGTICFFFANLKVVQLAVQGRLLQYTLLMQYMLTSKLLTSISCKIIVFLCCI